MDNYNNETLLRLAAEPAVPQEMMSLLHELIESSSSSSENESDEELDLIETAHHGTNFCASIDAYNDEVFKSHMRLRRSTAEYIIALVSILSAVGICERCRVESGGAYFLIAHTLGSRFGGLLGLLYCFVQAVGCALNVMGFGESMAGLVGLPESKWAIRGFATAAVLLLGCINVAGVKWVIKLQFILLMILLVSELDFIA